MRLQTILLPMEGICNVTEMYFHKAGSRIDFDGYFNLFYIEKRKHYTELQGLRLKLTLKGYGRVFLMHNRQVLKEEILREHIETEYCFEFPYLHTENGVFWFALEEADCNEKVMRGYYEGLALNPRAVNLVAAICTYKREPYILRNLKTIREQFFCRSEELDAATHMRLWLIDNGKTLKDQKEICQLITEVNAQDSNGGERIRIYPNRNAGGSGGFTRGMLEAVRQKDRLGLTHILLMDDDALFDPDLFVRVYGFLSTLKETYRTVTLGGTLLREDFPYIQQACGEWFDHFAVRNEHPLVDLRFYQNCTAPFLCESADEQKRYSGWWCCCYSLEVVRSNNLPIPLFLHHDDIEFGIRNRKNGIVFLNGVGVWHKGFELTFTGANLYYDVRNSLITTALHEPQRTAWEVKKWIWKRITAAAIEFRYAEAKLVYQGLIDFCKGPGWLYSQDPDKLNTAVRSQTALSNIEDLKAELTPDEYDGILQEIDQYRKTFGIETLRGYYSPEHRNAGLLKKATFNGWFLPTDKTLTAISATDSPFAAYRKKRVVLFEPFSGKATVAGRDFREFRRAVGFYIKTSRIIDRHYKRAASEYRERLREMTSQKAWEHYLGLSECKN